MGAYFLKRILLALPVLAVLGLLSFWLTQNTPGDPVLKALSEEGIRLGNDPMSGPEVYIRKWKELKLDQPVFYFALCRADEVDSLFTIPFPQDKTWVEAMAKESQQGSLALAFYHRLLQAESKLFMAKADTNRTSLLTFFQEIRSEEFPLIQERIQQFATQYPGYGLGYWEIPDFKPESTWKQYFPKLVWHGKNNQFHAWLVRLFNLDLGTSFRDGRPVSSKLPEALIWTVLVNFLSLILALGVSIPAGVYAAKKYGSVGERLLNGFLFILYSLPAFWVATLLLIIFSSGLIFDIFPAGGISDIRSEESWSLSKKITDIAWHLILPTFAYAYSSFAFLSGQIRNALLENLQSDYVRTARAKGVSETWVIWKHALRNSLLPLITLVGQILPGLISGSIILETIFTIPGMGMLTWQAISHRDYPVVIAVFMLTGVLTLLGVLLADLLYHWADPRIRLDKK
jgi:peptide/nickel transport system permease protein